MAKSITERRIKEAQQIFAEFGIKYITEWTEKQLQTYKNKPVIIPRGDYGFLIGTFEINGIHPLCWRVKYQKEETVVHDFHSKMAAIIYCFYILQNKLTPANQLLELDAKVGRLDIDIVNFQHSLKTCQNTLKWRVLNDRYNEAVSRKNQLSVILKKTLNSAKYLNFRNQLI
jgi:hypothetical protein